MRQDEELKQRYGIVFFRVTGKQETIVSIADPYTKSVVPISFTLEHALDYLFSSTSRAISREYNQARIHFLEGEKIGAIYKTYDLSWQEVPNGTLAHRRI
jgi:hypothetical protein